MSKVAKPDAGPAWAQPLDIDGTYGEEAHSRPPKMAQRQIDLAGLQPWMDGDTLTITVPTLHHNGPTLSPEADRAFTEAGLSCRDVEDALDDMWRTLQAKMFARLLSDRLK